MTYLPDATACSVYLNRRPSPIKSKVEETHPADIALCDVVWGELYFGARKSANPEGNLALLEEFFCRFIYPPPPSDGKAMRVYGQKRARLAALDTPIGPYDLQVAAIALAHGLIVITHNVSEFQRVSGLVVEDWQVEANPG